MSATEALCLTKFMNENDMKDWILWHIEKCKIDHIHFINNDSKFDLESLCKHFKDKVSYEEFHGIPRQYKLYDEYINYKSKSEWIIPIDDDEYLEISKEFDSVGSVIEYYKDCFPDIEMLAVRWKHLFPLKFKSERDCSVLDYCVREHLTLASTFQSIGDMGIKTFVHRSGKVHYQETWENPEGGHVPLHEKANCAIGFDGSKIRGNSFHSIPLDRSNEKIRLIHCRYRGYSDYLNKYDNNTSIRISDKEPREKKFIFDTLLPSLD